MDRSEPDAHPWPTIPAWVWLEGYGDADDELVPFVRLSYTRGVGAIAVPLPHTIPLLLTWHAACSDPSLKAWVPAWVWNEQDHPDPLACVSLDRVDNVSPRELLMPSSQRGRATLRKAVTACLQQLTGELTATAAIKSAHTHLLEAAPSDQHRDQHTETSGDSDDTADSRSSWPSLSVWMWLEEQPGNQWQAAASLSPVDGTTSVAAMAPVTNVGLTRLWLPITKMLQESETGEPRARSVPVWVWSSTSDNEPEAWVSFEKQHGVKSSMLDLPVDRRSLEALRDGTAAAMMRLTGCTSLDAAEQQLLRSQENTDATREPLPQRPPRKRKAAKGKGSPQALVPRERRMVLPRIRIVSGGLPSLGRR